MRRAGYEALEASTGQECLDAARRHRPDLILLDVMLPDILGLEVLREIKTDPELRGTFVILQSGIQISSDYQATGLNVGADGYIAKPISNKELLARVQAMERIKQAEDALRESERKHREFADFLPETVVEFDEKGDFSFANANGLETFGYTREDIESGLNILKTIIPEDHDRAREAVGKALGGGKTYGTEYTMVKKDGTTFPGLIYASSIMREDRAVGVRAIVIDITARKKTEEELRASERRYRTLFDDAIEGIVLADYETGIIRDCNRAFLKMTDYERSDLIGRPQTVLHLPEQGNRPLSRAFALHRSEREGEVLAEQLLTRDGTVKDVDIKANIIEVDGAKMLQGFFRDVTEERRGQREKETTLTLLRLLNDEDHTHELIRALTGYLREWTGCEAVGIRLRQGEDYPYFETRGFPPEFVEAENFLCARDLQGQVQRDDTGNPVLECMCGNILSGRFDPALPFFTGHGSFWTNSTTELLANTTESDRQARTRNRCNGVGYESVALIPLKHRGDTLGVLQINDHRKGRFTAELVSFLENACEQIAIALAQRATQAALRASEQRFRDVSEAAGEYMFEVDPEGRITFISDRVRDVLGYAPHEVLGKTPFDFVPPSEASRIRPIFELNARARTGFRNLEHQSVIKSGRMIWLSATVVPILDAKGVLLGYRGAAMDITLRKEAEEKLKSSLREKEVLLKEIHHRVKNNLQVMSSLLNLQSQYLDDPRALDIFRESMNRFKTMALIHDKLYRSENLSQIHFPTYVSDLTRDLVNTYASGKGIYLNLDVESVSYDVDTAIPLGLIINELVSNALKHAFPESVGGSIRVGLYTEGTRTALVVSDNGIGFPENLDFMNAPSMGMQLIVTLVEQIEGTIELKGDKGTEFTIAFETPQ